jgi:hypothetical protein
MILLPLHYQSARPFPESLSMSQSNPRLLELARVRSGDSTVAADRLSMLVVLFLLSLVFTSIIQLGPLRLSPYRILLLLCLIPCFVRWMSGGAGPIRMADICMILIALWGAVSWAVLHGASAGVESGGIHVVETLGAYFLGRCFIRTPEAFRRMAVLLFWIVIALLPFLLVEMLTGRKLILTVINSIAQTYPDAQTEPRLGLERAQGPFQHPILLGVYCGATVSLAYYVVAQGRRLAGRAIRTLALVLAGFSSLSSGPLAAIMAQLLMIGWDRAFERYRFRWWGLACLGVLGYVLVDIISNRSPLKVFISYLALNARTGYGRILILEWGWKAVLAHPLFGNVLGDWERPPWMTASVDMFWLQRAMAHGLPVGALHLLAFFLIVIPVARRELADPRLRDYRMGYLGVMVGLFIAGWAVHFWNEPYVLLMFLMGSGVWLLDHRETPKTPPGPAPSPPPARPRVVLG